MGRESGEEDEVVGGQLLVQFFYYCKSRHFTFMVFSSAMLMLLYIMGNVEVGVGLTLGLFAIFGVIRYRTETVPIREMTYLFVIIALAAMNGLAPIYKLVGVVGNNPHYELSSSALLVTCVANALVVCLIWVLESERLLKHTSAKLVLYDRIDLIVPEKQKKNWKGQKVHVTENTPKFGYIVMDEIPDKLIQYNKGHQWRETPFGSFYKINPDLNLHMEAMDFQTLLRNAKERNNPFFDNLFTCKL